MREIQIIVRSDLDKSPAMEDPVLFGFDGTDYEIDLSEDQYKELAALLRRYTDVARVADRKPASRTQRPRGATWGYDEAKARREQLLKVRTWAKDVKGIDIFSSSRIPFKLHEEYNQTHPNDQVPIIKKREQ